MPRNTIQQNFCPKNVFQWLLLVTIGLVLGYLMTFYLVSILGTLVFYVLLAPWYTYLTRQKRWSPSWAAFILLLFTFIGVVLPLGGLLYIVFQKIASFSENLQIYAQFVKKVEDFLWVNFHIDILQEKYWSQLQVTLTSWFSEAIQGTMGMIGNTALMYFLLFYALVENKRLTAFLLKIFPYQKRYFPFFAREIRSHILSNVIGSPLLALVQSVAAGIVFWWLEVPDALFWSLVCGVFSFIPLVGTAMVWVPVGLYFMLIVDWTSAIIVWAYGLLVISNVDNVFRFIFQKRFADIHPVITVMGILIGWPLFGALGIIFGPLVLSLFLLMLRIQFSWKR